MNILIIGSGGRESAIAWKLKTENPKNVLYAAPGNGGLAAYAECVDIDSADFDKIADFCSEKNIGLVAVGPEAPLASGLADFLTEKGITVFGTDKSSTRLEASKVFAKNFMKKYDIPTAEFGVFSDAKSAASFIEGMKDKWKGFVVKADGLCQGKGVIVCDTPNDAVEAAKKILVDGVFKEAGKRIVIEERISGEEVSVMAFSDGETVLRMLPAQDHKRAFDDDKGPNTGGMGAVCPVSILTEQDEKTVNEKVFGNFIRGIKAEAINFRGVIYAGIMKTEKGPIVLEFNTRFGDPETQVVLPLLKTELLKVMLKTAQHELAQISLEWEPGFCVSVVLASGGYPGKYQTGYEINGLETAPGAMIFHAGTRLENNRCLTSGGRVLNVSANGRSMGEAIERAYKSVSGIKFQDMHFRKDIGRKWKSK